MIIKDDDGWEHVYRYTPPPPLPCQEAHEGPLPHGIVIARNGVRAIRNYCPDCGWVAVHSYGFGLFTDRERDAMPVLRDNRQQETARCEVCNAAEVELHHWAPRHLFGNADDWPTAYLCPAHHREWHRTVTPAMHMANRSST